jgi:transglutaminase-like putative cysteine protease
MVYRYSWLAGGASIAFAYLGLNRLLRPTVEGPQWQLVVLAGLALGALITWAAVSYRLATIWVVALNVVAFGLTAVRFTTPETTVFVFPSRESVRIMGAELTRATDIIQNGVEPVVPIIGLVVIVTAVFWSLGALLVWGLLKGHPLVGLIPPLVVALQFATVDRNPTSLALVAMFTVLVGASAMAVNVDERDRGAGRMAHPGEWPSPRHNSPSPVATALLVGTIVAAVIAVGVFDRAVPADGTVAWRTSSGLTGGFYGSVAYNPFVSIQKGLVGQTETPLFTAQLDGDVDPADVYFRMLSLETYSNGKWFADDSQLSPLEDDEWEDPDQAYLGPTERLSADVSILALQMEWLPAPYAPIAAESEDRTVDTAIRVRTTDASLVYKGGRTYTEMEYAVTADIPQLDPGALATGIDGELSPLFAAAAEDEEVPDPVPDLERRQLDERYLALPDDLDSEVIGQTALLTANLGTAFEKGLALELWLRESGGFTYDTNVSAGHTPETLAAWLFDDSPENIDNYRRGYCEQFATSMAVMARAAGVPSRVVLGFTPGEDLGDGVVLVRDKNAHAWVELWVPTQGWVRFDPTPRGDAVNPRTYNALEEDMGFAVTTYLEQIPEEPVSSNDGGGQQGFPIEGRDPLEGPGFVGIGGNSGFGSGLPSWLTIVLPIIILAALVVLVIPLAKWWRRRRRMKRLEDGDVSAAWEEIVTRLTDLGTPPDPARTPVEAAADVDEAMQPLALVYSRVVYGEEDTIRKDHVRTATDSMHTTAFRLNSRYSPGRRFLAWYRISRPRLQRKPKGRDTSS